MSPSYVANGLRGVGLTAIILAAMVFPHPVEAQTYVDGDGEVGVSSGVVDCNGTGTSAEPSVSDAVAAGATDIDVCGGTYSGESFTLSSSVDIRPVSGSGTVTLASSQTGSAPFVINASDVTLRNLVIDHTGSSGEGVNTVDIQSGDNVKLVALNITREKLDKAFRTINLGNDQSVLIKNCDLNGGPIGDGESNGNYEIINNEISGTTDEGIWIYPEGNTVSIRGNTIERTSNGNATDDRKGIAVYAASSLKLEGNKLRVDDAAFLLGDDIPILHNGTTSPLETAGDMRDVLGRNTINGASPGKMTFVAQSNSTLRTNEDGVHIVRTGITNVPGSGGAKAYKKSALQVAESGDVLHLTGGATYPESVTLTSSSTGSAQQDQDVGFATPEGSNSTPATIDDLTLDGAYTVSVPAGEVVIGNSLTLGMSSSLTGTPLVLKNGSSVTDNGLSSGSLRATRTVGDSETESFGNIGLTLTDNGSGTSPGSVTVTRTDGEPITDGDGSIDRVYTVDATTSTGLDVDVDLEYDDGDNGGDDELTTASVSSDDQLAPFRSTDGGGTWGELTIDSKDLSSNVFTVVGLSELSKFTLAESGGTLPVELASFEGIADGQTAQLRWTTASETNNAGFRVQHRAPSAGLNGSAGEWETVTFVEGAGKTTENTSYRVQVSDLDYGTHAFRLEQVDRDGSTSLSEARRVEISLDGAYEVSGVSPNPVSSQGNLRVAVEEKQHVRIDVYDPLGRRVATLHDQTLEGGTSHQFTVRPQSLSNGHYFLRIDGEQFQATRRFVVLR